MSNFFTNLVRNVLTGWISEVPALSIACCTGRGTTTRSRNSWRLAEFRSDCFAIVKESEGPLLGTKGYLRPEKPEACSGLARATRVD